MRKTKTYKKWLGSERGITMVETMMASAILIIGSLSMISMIVAAIVSNNRNKIDSTQTMLAESIVEHVNSTLIGVGTSQLTDCAGHTYTIDTATGGANLTTSGASVDFTEDMVAAGKTNYHMDYYITNPCNGSSTSTVLAIYDVRWNVQKVGGSTTPTDTYLVTVSAKLSGHGEGNKFFSLPVTLRLMAAKKQ